MRTRIPVVIILGLVFGVFLISPAFSEEQEGAKALFFGDAVKQTTQIKATGSGAAAFSGTEVKSETVEQPSVGPQPESKQSKKKIAQISPKASGKLATGLSYWIEAMTANGKLNRYTAENRIFKSGERIRFAFKTNKDGYIYLLLIGSSGKGRTLFPDPRINNGDNVVTKNRDYRIPFGEKSFVMDATPGEEHVLVFFSESPIAEISKLVNPADKVEDKQVKEVYAFAETNGSKDIVFEEDVQGLGFQPASYVVNKCSDPKSVTFREILLKHK